MRATVIITKRGQGYISTASGQHGGGHQGARCGLTAQEAAAHAAQMMLRYGAWNAEGASLMAPDEVLSLVPEHLRSIEPTGDSDLVSDQILRARRLRSKFRAEVYAKYPDRRAWLDSLRGEPANTGEGGK